MTEKHGKNRKGERQQWNPNWVLKLFYRLWMLTFSLFKIALGAAATVVIIFFICGMVFAGILGDYLQEDVIPIAGLDLSSAETDKNSYLYYVDNEGNIQLSRRVNADSYSRWVEFEDIPEDLVHAAVAIEDKRFFQHQGVDWVTTVKACAGIFFGDDSKGGSTITQQLIKNITKDNSVTVRRKVMEICTATQLEKQYDKTVIMEEYLNRIFFGNKCYGVRTAAAKYFGKELESLTIAECASLISITNNPSLYDPYGKTFRFRGEELSGYERNAIRKLDTLEQMYEQGWITEEEYEQAVNEEIVNKDGIAFEDSMASCEAESCGYRGLVKTFRFEEDVYYCPKCGSEAPLQENEKAEVYSWFEDAVLEEVAMDLAARDGILWNADTKADYMKIIQNSGFHIYTTQDMDVQTAVDRIYEDLEQIPDTRSGQQLQSGIVIIDNRTGDVVALSGGVGEKNVYDAYSCATDAKLQTGSSIKPLTVYAPAFELGVITPATVVKDLPFEYDEEKVPWPKNDDRKYSFAKTIRSGVVSSTNAVAVNTLDIIGAGYSYQFARELFGLSTLTDHYETSSGQIKTDENFAALGLGALTRGVTVRDMATAFAVFPSNGLYRESRLYTKVYDSEGNLVLDNTQDSRQILGETAVQYMNYCLDEATAVGTGTNGDFRGMSVASKTGTTNDAKDRWYCGYTHYYTAAVWVGYLTPEPIQLVGDFSNPAGRLFKKVMEPIHEGLKNVPLYNASDFKTVKICLDSGLLASQACTQDVRLLPEGKFTRVDAVKVLKDDKNVPEDVCTKHVLVDYCTTGHGVANAYCKLFAAQQLPPEQQVVIEKKGLVKITPEELEAISLAEEKGLHPEYITNAYIYLVSEKGDPVSFKGIRGDANVGVDAPYIVCPLHNQQAWEAYQAALPPVETEPDDSLIPEFSFPDFGFLD